MNEKVNKALAALSEQSAKLYDANNEALETIKEVLRPCKGSPCLLGTEDYCEDIYYVYGEPKPNVHRRALAIRLNQINNELEVQLDGEPIGAMGKDGWTNFRNAFIGDVQFLVEEVSNNIEFSDGYQDDDE